MIWNILPIILTGIALSLVFGSLRTRYFVLWKRFLKSCYYLRLSAYKTLHPARWYDVFALIVEIAFILIDFIGLIIIGPWYNIIRFGIDGIKKRRKAKDNVKKAAQRKKFQDGAGKFSLTKRQPEFVWKNPPVYIYVQKGDLKFLPSEKEVIYYEKNYSEELNDIISSHYAELCHMARKHYRELIYLPEYNKSQAGHNLEAEVSYLNPRHTGCMEVPSGFITYHDILTAYHINEDISGPCLIRCMSHDEQGDTFRFSIRYLESTDYETFVKEFSEYLHSTQEPVTMYHLMSDKEYEEYMSQFTADDRFDSDVRRMVNEIRSRIMELESRGMSSLVIRKLIGDVPDKPGRLLVDKHFRIILPDYNDMEIDLSPLQKTVFILFLRHPEGIYFKELDDYQGELFDIYSSITGRSDTKAIMQSIEKLTDPYDNSINEKCARIKMAFTSKFNDEIARWYYVDGKKGGKKTILIPRDLVTWECTIQSR